MSIVVLRLASPLQSWSGYRLALNMDSVAPTEAVPRKSAVNGLIGAALGSRDLSAIGREYDLHVRVERTNPVSEDFQVISPLPGYVSPTSRGRATQLAERHERLASATTAARFPSSRNGGNFSTGVSKKDYLSHSEFLVGLDTRGDTARAGRWLTALRDPVFMPYLGRKSCPPSFPYVLGVWGETASELWAELPHVRISDSRAGEGGFTTLRSYLVQGDYDVHADSPSEVVAPVVERRAEQLAWVKESLG